MIRISCWRMNRRERWTRATSVQVMDLLKEVAKDRLVVMVTHNPELAEEYATRIVNAAGTGRSVRIRTNSYVDEAVMKRAGA